MRKKITLIAWLCVFVCMQSFAQDRTLTGKITSKEDNNGIPGVSVAVVGTTIGTTTDIDGNYKLSVPSTAKQLKFSGVGLKSKTVDIGASDAMDMAMENDVLKLDEVVVTALGISREKKALAYSTQTVSDDQLNNSGSGNVLSELSGKVAGLSVINSNGDPGSGTYVQLRGVTSLTGNNQPLIVIDGVPIDNSINNFDPTQGYTIGQTSGSAGNSVGGANPENRGIDINPNDIASVTVLKGPAATALYGIDAASGALIITTKRGGGPGAVPGPSVMINSSTSWSSVNKLPERQDTYSQGTGGVFYGPYSAGSGGRRVTWGAPLSTLSWDGVSNEWDPNGKIVLNTDPTAKKAVTAYNPYDFFQTGITYDNNVAISGGNDKSGYRLSIGNVKTTGIIPNTNYVKTNFGLSGQSMITKRMSASVTLNYVKSGTDKVQQGSNVQGVMLGLLRTPPTFDNSYGLSDPANDPSSYVLATPGITGSYQRSYRGGGGYDNPYWTVNRNPYRQDLDRFFGSAQVDYKLCNWLSAIYRLGGDFYSQNTKNGSDIYSSQFSTGAINLVDFTNSLYNSDLILKADHRWNNDWNTSLVLGHNYYTTSSTNRLMQGNTFAIPTWYDLANSASFISNEGESKLRRMAEYAEAQVEYKSQVFLTLTGRNETSSSLPKNNNTFFYPSASLGWIFTEALGMADNKIFPYGKIRLSYASVGKDAPVQGLQTYYSPTHVSDGWSPGIYFPIDGVPGFSYSSTSSVLGNPDLKPEHTTSFEIGPDLAFFQNRVNLSATYYHYKTTDGIFLVPISYATGFASQLANAAEITNNGIEISLNLTPVKMKNGFQWDIGFNWSKNKNIVTDLAPGIDNLFLAGFTNGGVYAVKGQPFGVIYGSRYVRVNSSDDNSAYLINDEPANGPLGYPIPGSKNGVIGNIQPDWIGSVTTSLSWKGVTLTGQLDIHQGGQIWNGTRGAMTYFGTSKESGDRTSTKTFDGQYGHLDIHGNVVHYAPDGVTEIAGAGNANSTNVPLNQYYWQNIGSSFIGPQEPSVEDGSFVKLRTVSLGYEFPKSLIKKAKIGKLGISVFGNNFIVSTKYKGVDPETSLIGPANGQGLDYFNNPGAKSFGFRIILGL